MCVSRSLSEAYRLSSRQIWDLKTYKIKLDLPGHTDEVYCVDFVADKVVSGGRDKVVKMYVLPVLSPHYDLTAYATPSQMEKLDHTSNFFFSSDLPTQCPEVCHHCARSSQIYSICSVWAYEYVRAHYTLLRHPMDFMWIWPTFLVIFTRFYKTYYQLPMVRVSPIVRTISGAVMRILTPLNAYIGHRTGLRVDLLVLRVPLRMEIESIWISFKQFLGWL